MTRPRLRTRSVHLFCLFYFSVLTALAFPRIAVAEKVLAKGDDWEVYTDGRAGGFLSYVHGDALPQSTYGVDASGNQVLLHDVKGGGFDALAERQPDPSGMPGVLTQGTINSMRVRSGFIGNTLGLGVRNKITETTTATGYIQIWAWVESMQRQKNQPNYADVRQGYAKLQGSWGSLLAGRTRGLFSRGATDIDTMYAHRYGVGFPGSSAIDDHGPTQGHIGFGVAGSGFASGLIYGTPVLRGFQLNVGAFDPIQLQNGGWVRTKWPRAEGEMTFERLFGETGKVVLFANGAYQTLYLNNYCPVAIPPAQQVPCSATAKGVGYGGRFELGPVRLGVAGHYGRGLGLNYALEVSDANSDSETNLRLSDGYYVQSMFVLRKFDVSAGWGITRIFLNPSDNKTVADPTDPTGTRQIIAHSVIKHQMGISAGVVYNYTPSLHFDLDFFRAEAAWFLGEKQVVYVANSGMIFNW